MKYLFSIFVLALAASLNAPAQIVTVQVSLDQDQFLPGETLPVTVRVINHSGQTLDMGADAGWLRFRVQPADSDSEVMSSGQVPVQGEFKLGSSEVATKRVDIAPYFALDKPGRYRITAVVHIKEWGTDVESAAKKFNVIDGARIWTQAFGVPATGGSNQLPKIRNYVLEEANYLKNQLRLYVLVTDVPETHVIKVSAIGQMVSFGQPEAQVDRMSNLHVLNQSGAHSFIYAVVSPDGVITTRDIYVIETTRPHLGLNAKGDIVVTGGVRRPAPGELPVVKTPDEVPLQSQKQ
jgi:hypothetical protein